MGGFRPFAALVPQSVPECLGDATVCERRCRLLAKREQAGGVFAGAGQNFGLQDLFCEKVM
eukprot:2726217-Prymnesium_polylepis.1